MGCSSCGKRRTTRDKPSTKGNTTRTRDTDGNLAHDAGNKHRESLRHKG